MLVDEVLKSAMTELSGGSPWEPGLSVLLPEGLCAEGGDGGYFLALVLAPYLFATATLALVLLGRLMEIHTPTSACCTSQILGFTLWQLLSYCQEEMAHVHSCLG